MGIAGVRCAEGTASAHEIRTSLSPVVVHGIHADACIVVRAAAFMDHKATVFRSPAGIFCITIDSVNGIFRCDRTHTHMHFVRIRPVTRAYRRCRRYREQLRHDRRQHDQHPPYSVSHNASFRLLQLSYVKRSS